MNPIYTPIEVLTQQLLVLNELLANYNSSTTAEKTAIAARIVVFEDAIATLEA